MFPLIKYYSVLQATTTTPGIKSPGMWLSFLFGLVSVLGQESEQVCGVWADQDALAIQGIVTDDVGECGCSLVGGYAPMASPMALAMALRALRDTS